MLTKSIAAVAIAAAALFTVTPIPAQAATTVRVPAGCTLKPATVQHTGLLKCGWWIDILPRLEGTKARPRTYVVAKGDTLWRIAVTMYSTGTEGPQEHAGQQYRRIMRLNHLTSTRIHPGQILRLR